LEEQLMSKDYSIFADEAFIRIVYIGKARYEIITQMFNELASVARDTGKRKLLFDIREADYKDDYAIAIQHAKHAADLGFDIGFRIAVIGAQDDAAMLQYIEDISVNRGFETRVFLDENEAVRWLTEN
jgi:hypothetical protein